MIFFHNDTPVLNEDEVWGEDGDEIDVIDDEEDEDEDKDKEEDMDGDDDWDDEEEEEL